MPKKKTVNIWTGVRVPYRRSKFRAESTLQFPDFRVDIRVTSSIETLMFNPARPVLRAIGQNACTGGLGLWVHLASRPPPSWCPNDTAL